MKTPFSEFFSPLKPGEMVKISSTLTAFPLDIATLMETQRRNLQAFATLQQLGMESLQVIAHRQSALFSDLTEAHGLMAREWSESDAPEDKIADQALILKEAYERMISHLREINDMIAQSQSEMNDVVHKRVSATLVGVKDAIDRTKAKRAA